MIAPLRRVRVSRTKRKILRLLPATLIAGSSRQCSRQQKGVFLLVVDFWHIKPEYWPGAMKSKINLAKRKKRICVRNRLVLHQSKFLKGKWNIREGYLFANCEFL